MFFLSTHTSLWTKLLLRDRTGLRDPVFQASDVCPFQPPALQPPIGPMSPHVLLVKCLFT